LLLLYFREAETEQKEHMTFRQ